MKFKKLLIKMGRIAYGGTIIIRVTKTLVLNVSFAKIYQQPNSKVIHNVKTRIEYYFREI